MFSGRRAQQVPLQNGSDLFVMTIFSVGIYHTNMDERATEIL